MTLASLSILFFNCSLRTPLPFLFLLLLFLLLLIFLLFIFLPRLIGRALNGHVFARIAPEVHKERATRTRT